VWGSAGNGGVKPVEQSEEEWTEYEIDTQKERSDYASDEYQILLSPGISGYKAEDKRE
jgi:hypothetical protein